MTATVNGTTATFALTGSDPDGDALTWSLTFGDGSSENGTALPADVPHTYAAAGNVSATYTLRDGKTASVFQANLTLVAGGSTGGAPIQTTTGSWDLGSPQTCSPGEFYANPYHPANAAATEVIHLIADVNAATIGRTFTATFGAAGPGQQSVALWFSSPTVIVIEAFAGAGPLTGVVPEGAEKVTFATCGPAGNSVTYVA